MKDANAIELRNISKRFGKVIANDRINLSVRKGEILAILGENGSGKTTLMNMISGIYYPDEGQIFVQGEEVTIRSPKDAFPLGIGMIHQHFKLVDVLTAAENIVLGLSGPTKLDITAVATRISKLTHKYGFELDPFKKIYEMSVSEKQTVEIVKMLYRGANILILDEPTNHLDFKTLNWLEEYLINYKGSLLIVSHDRYFLDKTVDNIFELERGRLTSYKGNYSKYLILKEERKQRLLKEYEAQQNELSQLQAYVDKNIARASTSASAKSRLKTIENMDIIDKPDGDLKRIKLKFDIVREPYKDVLTVSDLDVCVGEEKKTICRNINLSVKRGEKIALIGDNGVGKSSFLKTILDIIPHEKGEIVWGKNTTVSYYEQENLNLNPDNLAIDELWDRFPDIPEARIRRVLGSVLLTKEDVYKPVKVISGGERAKLAFCIIMLEKSNVILFDEPTNHLDLPSKEILEKAMQDYEGTLIFVSHDRYLLNKVPDKIIEMKPDGVLAFDGNFEYYKERSQFLENQAAEKAALNKESNRSNRSSDENKDGGYRSKEQRRLDAQRKSRIKELETLIAEKENENTELETDMAKEEVYTDYVLMSEKTAKLDENTKLLEEYYDEWAELSE